MVSSGGIMEVTAFRSKPSTTTHASVHATETAIVARGSRTPRSVRKLAASTALSTASISSGSVRVSRMNTAAVSARTWGPPVIQNSTPGSPPISSRVPCPMRPFSPEDTYSLCDMSSK